MGGYLGGVDAKRILLNLEAGIPAPLDGSQPEPAAAGEIDTLRQQGAA